ncbi:hypothetical protein ADP71_17600 [Vitreoscilla sp. C1]|uniref:PD-(D/E)XK nuclease family protein n=1 Tax=Vitreoscilla sp. (strain C1) TaxID=96942 RepID=UPI00148EC9C1|nr:PD-(D/E)XK nuclease family protein [Vitreoscilla sp. C1]AUZ05287.2 hypothetical protein ADP71_17600 [Vitreoscilla sp. C1]
MDSIDVAVDELSRLQSVLEQAKSLHTSKKEMTFFDTALRKHYENPTTELLAFFLNSENEHGLNGVFYQGLLAALRECGVAQSDTEAWGDVQNVHTEVVTSKGRIDLLIETDQAVLAIECKIGHHQNNPFTDYERYVRQHYPGKKQVFLILCVDGKSHAAAWTGLSYRTLATHTRPLLAEALLNQPYNKWTLFAREFLMHWEQLGVDVMNEQQVDFVVEHLGDIKKMVTLRDDFYRHVRDHITEALENQLKGYEVHYRVHTWPNGPALRFANNHCPTWTEVVVNLHIDEKPLQYSLQIRIDKQTDALVKLACKELKKLSWIVNDGDNTWAEINGRYWVCAWEGGDFDLTEVCNEVVTLMRILMKVEAARAA